MALLVFSGISHMSRVFPETTRLTMLGSKYLIQPIDRPRNVFLKTEEQEREDSHMISAQILNLPNVISNTAIDHRTAQD
jgi:hypothetical protein